MPKINKPKDNACALCGDFVKVDAIRGMCDKCRDTPFEERAEKYPKLRDQEFRLMKGWRVPDEQEN